MVSAGRRFCDSRVPSGPACQAAFFFSIHGFGVSFETEREHCVQADPDRDLQIIIGAGQNLIEGVVEPPIADFIGRGLSCSHSSHLIQDATASYVCYVAMSRTTTGRSTVLG